MNDAVKLLPCAHCGGNKLHTSKLGWVECQKCAVSAPYVETWQTRAPDVQSIMALISAMKRLLKHCGAKPILIDPIKYSPDELEKMYLGTEHEIFLECYFAIQKAEIAMGTHRTMEGK